MPKPYSLDLRERVVRFVDEGHSRHAAAAHFRVSVSFVVNLVKAFRVRGSLAPKPSGGRRHAKLEPHRAFLLQKVAEKADITMPELAAELASRNLPEGRSRLAFALAHPHWLSLQKTYGPPRLQGGLSRLAADPVCINVSGLEELPPAMMEIRTLRSS